MLEEKNDLIRQSLKKERSKILSLSEHSSLENHSRKFHIACHLTNR